MMWFGHVPIYTKHPSVNSVYHNSNQNARIMCKECLLGFGAEMTKYTVNDKTHKKNITKRVARDLVIIHDSTLALLGCTLRVVLAETCPHKSYNIIVLCLR